MKSVILGLGTVLAMFVVQPEPSLAQTYPTRSVTFMIPFAAGGGTDVLARMMAQKLSDRFGKPFVPENRAGAGTVIAATAVANAAPDGYTILMGTSSTLAVNPAMYKKLPYDPKNLVPVSLLARVPFVLTVNPSLPIHSVADLAKYAQDHPDALNYGSVGPGSFQHIATETMKSLLNINMVHVPYKGGPALLADFLGGSIQVAFIDLGSGAGELIRAGKMRAIGLSSAERLPSEPDIPPLAEGGLPSFDIAAWQMVMTPAGTPPAILDQLNKALNDTVLDKDVSKQIISIGYIPIGKGTPEELARFVASEAIRWHKMVEVAGVAGSE